VTAALESEAPATFASWLTLAALVAISLFAFVDRYVLILVSPDLARSLRLSDTQLGALQGLTFALFTLSASYPLAWLADRYDRRLVLAGCVLTWAVGTAACAFATNFVQIVLAAIAIAAGEAGLTPIAVSLVPDLFTGTRRIRANLIYYAACSFGISVGLLVGGAAFAGVDALRTHFPIALGRLENWRLAFLMVALPTPLFLALIACMTTGAPRRPPRSQRIERRMLPYLGEHGSVLARIILAVAMVGFAFGGLFAWIPVATARLFGANPTSNGLGMGIAAATAALVGVVISGLMMRRFWSRLGTQAAVRISWMAMMPGLPVLWWLPFVDTAWQAYAVVALQLACGTVIGSLIPTILQDVAPPELRGRVLALYLIIYTSVYGLSALVVGALSDRMGGGAADIFKALAGVGMFGWTSAFLLMRSVDQRIPQTIERLHAASRDGSVTLEHILPD
jgi:MFS family permease